MERAAAIRLRKGYGETRPHRSRRTLAIQRIAVPSIAAIQSEGDLEVVLLHETHSVLAEIIGPELYAVGGIPPEQSVLFHTRSSFNLFLVLVVEFFAEGTRSACINSKFQNWSLLKGLRWFCDRYADESSDSWLHGVVMPLTYPVDKITI